MECKDYRKKLQGYAEDKIEDEFLKKDLEEHVKSCAVCKKELLMWQEVIEKRKAVSKMMPKGDIHDRVKRRMKNMNTDPQLPRIVMQMQAVGRFMSNPKGCMMIQLLLVLGGFMFYFFFIRRDDTNILVPILFSIAFIAMVFLIFKKWKGK